MKKRSKGSDDFNSDNDNDFAPNSNVSNDVRHEEICRQCIESEQCRHGELCDSYHWLKNALPMSNQMSSKASLSDWTTMHIRYLGMMQRQLQTQLAQAEAETAHLRQ